MPTYVDDAIHETNSLSGFLDKYSAQLDEAGFGEADRNAFKPKNKGWRDASLC